MIEALRELGIYSLKAQGLTLDDEAAIFTEKPTKRPKETKVININFQTNVDNNDLIDYIDVLIEDYFPRKERNYLYSRGSSNGTNFTPTSKVTDDLIKKTYPNKVKKWFENNFDNESKLVMAISESFLKNSKYIEEALRGIILESKINYLITVRLDNKYLGDFKEFMDILVTAKKQNYNKNFEINCTCSLCGNKGKVYGQAFPIKFYTLDKPGYIAGGFNSKEGYRNFPICYECILYITAGRVFMEDNLEYRFSGLPYYLIPRDIKNDFNSFDELLTLITYEKDHKITINNEAKRYLAGQEEDCLDLISDYDDIFTLTFLFFEKQNAKFSVNLLMEDIFPGRLKELFKAKGEADRKFLFIQKQIDFNFYILRKLFRDFENNISLKNYLNLIDKIFKGISISKEYLLSKTMLQARKSFAKGFSGFNASLEGLSIMCFMENLNILRTHRGSDLTKEDVLMSSNGNGLSRKVKSFFKDYENTFPESSHKGIFLLGVLTQYLLNVQHNKRGSAPFRSQLKGLRLKEEDVISLLPKVIEKLEQYDANYYKKLETIISQYLIQAGRNWSLSTDEINFLFVVGMNLADLKDKGDNLYFKIDPRNIEKSQQLQEV